RMLGALPAHGRQFYEAMYGPRARRLLTEARDKGDARLVAEVAGRYPHTAAGAEATRLLGAHHLDRGRYALAALCFERLLDRPEPDELSPATLFHAALALRRAGSGGRAEQAWGRLAARASAGLRLGGIAVTLEELRKELDRTDGSAAGAPTLTRLEAKWTQPTALSGDARSAVQAAVLSHIDYRQPVLPGSTPLLAGDLLVYRSSRGL